MDEARGVAVRGEPRFRKEYDADQLAVAFPRLAVCVKPAVDSSQLETCVRAGQGEEVLTKALHSRALVVKPFGWRRR